MTSYQDIHHDQSTQLTHAHIIQSDAEALEIAHHLAEKFKINADLFLIFKIKNV